MNQQPRDYDPHEVDPADVFYDGLSDILFWLFVGFVIGVAVTVTGAWVWSFWL